MRPVKRKHNKVRQVAILELHEILKNNYPQLFSKPFSPFAIRIHEQVLDAEKCDPRILKMHLRNIASHPLYLFNFLDDSIRYRLNLDGSISDEIQLEERDYARMQLILIMEHHQKKYRRKIGEEKIEEILKCLGKV